MAIYNSQYTGAQIDEAVGAVLSENEAEICDMLYNASTTPAHSVYTGTGLFDIYDAENGSVVTPLEEVGNVTADLFQFEKVVVVADEALVSKVKDQLTKSYQRTRNTFAEKAVSGAGSVRFKYGSTLITIMPPQGMPVFNSSHYIGTSEEEMQSNYYYAERGADEDISAELVEKYLDNLAGKMRTLRDDNGDILGYEPDTIIIPANIPKLELAVRKATKGSRWKVVAFPNWSTSVETIILLSSKANKELGGNIMVDAEPLTITSEYSEADNGWVVHATAKFGVCFGAYQHMLMFTSATPDTTIPGATELTD